MSQMQKRLAEAPARARKTTVVQIGITDVESSIQALASLPARD